MLVLEPGYRIVAILERLANELREFSGQYDSVSSASLGDYAIDGHLPSAVFFPFKEELLTSILSLANREMYNVVPRGSGALVELGNCPSKVDIVLGTTRLESRIDHRPDDLTVTVSSGTPLGVLQEHLALSNQWVLLDPPLASHRTIGGILATNLDGPLSLGQGLIRDQVIGMKVAGPSGEITKSGGKVVKNVTGFDIQKLHIGALGTLGVILETSFKVWPLPKLDATLVLGYQSLSEIANEMNDLRNSHCNPDAEEVIISFQNGIEHTAYLRFMGSSKGVKARLDEAKKILRYSEKTRKETCVGAASVGIWPNLANFGWEPNDGNLLLRFICLPSKVFELANIVKQFTEKEELDYSFLASFGRGNARLLILENLVSDKVYKIVENLRGISESLGGYMTIERVSSEIKLNLDVWSPLGNELELMKRVKNQLDPLNVLNKGRYVGGI